MQIAGVLSLFVCVLCMAALFAEQVFAAKIAFGASLALMAISLAISLCEIHVSVNALNLQLQDLARHDRQL
jgi:hypothetical protein